MLTDNFKVVDYQATPSGYYLIRFRDKDGNDVVVEQTGKGGCNRYHCAYPALTDSFDSWLSDNAHLFIGFWEGRAKVTRDDYDQQMALSFAQAIRERRTEWQDVCMLIICEGIERRAIPVEG